MTALTIPFSQQQQAISSASQAYHVPEGILWGVYGKETDFGRDVSTSTAGAVGAFQFIPSTAAQFGYPQTNTPAYPQFWQQAQDAAKLLQQLYQAHGSWDAALQGYSGGAYGLSDVIAKATGPELGQLAGADKAFMPGLIASMIAAGVAVGAGAAAIGGEAGAAAGGASGAGTAAEGATAGGASGAGTAATLASKLASSLETGAELAAIWEWLRTASHWVRILEFVGGAVLVYLAVKGLAEVGGENSGSSGGNSGSSGAGVKSTVEKMAVAA